MHKPFEKLLSFWLAVALCIAPLPVLTAEVAPDQAAPCQMRLERVSDHLPTAAMQSAGHHLQHHHAAASAGSDCPQCQQDICSDDCSPIGCTAVHLHPGAIASLVLAGLRGSDSNVALLRTTRDSRTDPPPLRPPL